MMYDLCKLGNAPMCSSARRIKLYSVPKYGYRSTGRSALSTGIGPTILSGLILLMNL